MSAETFAASTDNDRRHAISGVHRQEFRQALGNERFNMRAWFVPEVPNDGSHCHFERHNAKAIRVIAGKRMLA